MDKGKKKVGRVLLNVLSCLVLCAIIVPLLAVMLFSLPRVQTFAGVMAARWASDFAETEIGIGSVGIKGLNRIEITDFYIMDYYGDTVVYIAEANAAIDRNALLLKGRLAIGDLRAEGVELSIYKPLEGKDNLSQIFLRIREKMGNPESKPFELNDISVTNSVFSYRDEKRIPVKNGIDYTDMLFTGVSASSNRLRIDGKRFECELHNVSGTERSGVRIDALSTANVVVDEGLLEFDDARILTEGAVVNFALLRMEAPEWDAYQSFADSVSMRVEVRNSRFDADNLNRFVSGISGSDLSVAGFNATYDGLLSDFVLNITSARIAERTSLTLFAEAKGVTDLRHARFDVQQLNLQSDAAEVASLYRTLTEEELPQQAASYLSRCGSIWLSGSAEGYIDDFAADLVAVTDVGRIDVDGEVNMSDSGDFAFTGAFSGSDVNLGRVVDIADLGKAAFAADGEVAVSEGRIEGDARIGISRLQYKGYNYTGVAVEASMADSLLRLTASSTDRNLRLELDGNCDFADRKYDFVFDLQNADFEALGLSNRRSWLSCNMEASGSGFDLDEIEFRAMAGNLVYISPTDTLSTDVVNLIAGHTGDRKSVSIYSSLFDAEYRSTESYRDAVRYLTSDFLAQFPLFDAQQPMVVEPDGALNSTFTLNLKSDSFAENVVDKLRLSSETMLYFAFDPIGGGYSLSLDSGFVEWGDYLVSNVILSSDNFKGHPELRLDADEIFALGTQIPEITIEAATVDGNVDLSLIFGNAESIVSGNVSASAMFGHDAEGRVTVKGSIADSSIADVNESWTVAASSIDYIDGVLTIDDFSALCGDQSLLISGEVSDRPFSMLQVRLDNIDLYPPLQLALGDKIVVNGRLDGYARLGSLLGNPNGGGELTISGVDIDGIGVDPLQLSALLPSTDRLDFSLHNTLSGEVLLNGNYNFAGKTYEAGVKVAKMDVSLLDPLLSGIVTDSEGTASLDLKIEGTGRRPSIFGTVGLDGMTAKLIPTGVAYNIESALLHFNGNNGVLQRTSVTDQSGHNATLDGSVDLADLSDINYRVRLVPNDFMVLDTDAETTSNFYGTLFVSGAVDLRGTSSGNTIDAVIRTVNNSVVSLRLGGSADFAGADYIRFVDTDPAAMVDTTNVIELKRLQFNLKNQLARRKKKTEISAALQVGTDTQLRLIIDPATDNVLTARGTADLNVTLDSEKNDFQIRGDYRISEGNYRFNFENIISKDFTLNPDSYIRWNGGFMDADIDISAVYRLKTSLSPLLGVVGGASNMTSVDCIINLKNRLSAIDLSFGINVPNADTEYQSILSSYFSSQEMMATQFVYLLALGTFYAENDTATQGTAFGSAAGSAIGLGFLTNQVSRLLSNDSYQFNLKYKQRSDYSSSGYGVDFQTELIDDRLLLELEANVDTGDNAMTDMNPISGGGSLTLLLDNTGNFIMKGFSRTIDRFDENQGLQESGVGVYYGRSFNRFGDLFRKNRDKRGTDSRNKQKK